MFDLVHSKQKEGYQDEGLASATHTNPSFAQQEYGDGITSPSDSMAATVWARYRNKEKKDALGIISKDINQINQMDIIPLVDDLEMLGIFKDKDKEEGDSVTDALSTML